MIKKFENDDRADRLEKFATIYKILSWVTAIGLIILMFVLRPCLDRFNYSGECFIYDSPNYFYILWAVLAIFQGYFVEQLLLAAARALNYLKGIFDNTNIEEESD